MNRPPNSAPLLTSEQLDCLIDRLRGLGAVDAIERFQPGIADDEIDATLAPTGLSAPAEVRVLWRWRNGQPDWQPEVEGPIKSFYIKSFRIMTAAEAAASYVWEREISERLRPDIGFDNWPRTFLPVMQSQRPIACETNVAPGEPSTVHMYVAGLDFTKPFAASLGELVDRWIDAIDTGNWTYDRDTGKWHVENVYRPDGTVDEALE